MIFIRNNLKKSGEKTTTKYIHTYFYNETSVSGSDKKTYVHTFINKGVCILRITKWASTEGWKTFSRTFTLNGTAVSNSIDGYTSKGSNSGTTYGLGYVFVAFNVNAGDVVSLTTNHTHNGGLCGALVELECIE